MKGRHSGSRDRVAADGTVVEDWLLWRSRVSPRQPALRCGPVQWSYEELNEKAGNVAELLLSRGIRKGHRVGLILRPSEKYVATVHALTRIGAVTVPMNVRQSYLELLRQLMDCRPSLVLYDHALSHLKERIAEEASGSKFRWMDSAELEIDGPSRRPLEKSTIDLSSLHSIIYTSGSAGRPKGVEITGSNLLWNAISVGLRSGTSPSDRWLLVLPLFHVGGYTILFRSVLHGSSIVLHREFEPSAASESLDRDGITLTSLVPAMLERLLLARRRRFPPSLRQIFLGGSPPSISLMREIRERRLPVQVTYGMTETCSQVAISQIDSARGSDGILYRPMFPTAVAIRIGKSLASRSGRAGEILVRGPTVFKGYWRDQETTSEAFEDGWFRTGDIGFLDGRREGVVVVGRRDEMIKSGGEKIYPAEVESFLLEHDAVEDAVVVGREDRKWGQRVEAAVKIREGFIPPSPSDLTEFLRERLGSYKIPKRYHFWPSIPKTPTGKTKRRVVKELLESGESWPLERRRGEEKSA